jgi:PAS domain S-box-containing protein
MCNLHSVVLQTERIASIAKIDSLQRTIVTLQQQACSLASQVHERTRIKEAPASLAAVSRKNAQLHTDLQQENSARKRAEETLLENEAYIRRLMEATIIGVTFWHVDGGISYANDTFLQLSGYSAQDLLSGKILWTDMTPLEYRAREEMAMEELIKTGTCKPVEKEYIRKDGTRVPVLVGLAMLKGSRERGVSFVLDLTARKQAEEQVRRMANHDALTSLPNRMLLQDRMHQAIAFAHRNHSRVAILLVDLDYFKNINDSLGHHVGDEVLKMTAMHLQKSLREGDSVSRLGGDEFVLILPLLSKCLFEIFLPGSVKLRTLSGCEKITQAT